MIMVRLVVAKAANNWITAGFKKSKHEQMV